MTPIDPTTVKGYLGDPDNGIYRYRVYFTVNGRPMTIDYFARDWRDANAQFDEAYPNDETVWGEKVHVERVVNMTRNPQTRRGE